MNEALLDHKIVPYCLTCIAVHKVNQEIASKERLKAEKAASPFTDFIEKTGERIIFTFKLLVVLFILSFLAIFPVLLIGVAIILPMELLGYGSEAQSLNDSGNIYYFSIPIFVLIALISALYYSKDIFKERVLKKKNPEIQVQITLDSMKNSMHYGANYQKARVATFKKEITNQFRYKTSNIEQIDLYDGVQFEKYMAIFFEKTGYQVKTTPASGDNGIDLIISRSGIRIGVQCKRYTGNVSVSAVQEAYAGKDMHNCNEAMVITTSYFTAPAKKMASKLRVNLWDRDRLIQEIMNVTDETNWDDYLRTHYDLTKVNQVSI